MLSLENIKAELSYAYLHAIASRAGFDCCCTSRHADAAAVDATISARGQPLASDSILTDFTVEVQLKATAKSLRSPKAQPEHYPFRLKVEQYDKLRSVSALAQKILVVLVLPTADRRWLMHGDDHLIARRSAYWVSLRGAPQSSNQDSQTIYIPKTNRLTTQTLHRLMTRISREERLLYAD